MLPTSDCADAEEFDVRADGFAEETEAALPAVCERVAAASSDVPDSSEASRFCPDGDCGDCGRLNFRLLLDTELLSAIALIALDPLNLKPYIPQT